MDATTQTGRTRRVRMVAGFALGVALLGAALVVVVRSGPSVRQAADAVAQAPAWLVGAVLLAPVLSWLASAGTLWALTRRFGRVGAGEMAALVGSAWLLNYLPLKPGLVGRVAYHKRVNAIRVKDSARVLVESTLIAVPCAAAMLGLGLAFAELRTPLTAQLVVLAAPGAALGLGVAATRAGSAAGWVLLAVLLRYADLLVWVGRYAAVFAALGHPLALPECVLIAAVSQAALMVPIAGNGLGVREWAVGLTAGAAGSQIETALAADLVCRAAEVGVCVPIGLLCARAVARKARRGRRGARIADSCEPPADPAESEGGAP